MSVNYSYISDEGPEFDKVFDYAACFSSLTRDDVPPTTIQYRAAVKCQMDHAELWVAFIGEWLDEDRFVAIQDDENPFIIEFWLDCRDLTVVQKRLYLTAFRCVDEFSHLLKLIYDAWKVFDAEPNQLFIMLCDIHKRGDEGGYGMGHSLASNYSMYIPGWLTIDEFQERLIDDSMRCVHQHFEASTRPRNPILDQVVDPCF